MSYVVFARKFRPQQLDQVIGQEHIVTTLKNAFIQDRITQSFLFVGTRGVGKTSTARIIAKALNCSGKDKREPYESCDTCPSCREIMNGSGLDVLEIDGASNRGIDEIRNLRDTVKFKPMHGRYKVYIIDEVHMLTQEAFNALLKTLEEPPAHVKFIFATTEPHKIPQTILSRCQRYDFRQIKTGVIVDTLRTIAEKEKITIDEKTLYLIAKNAEGSMRDAESLLDKVANALAGTVTFTAALQTLGVTDTTLYYNLMTAIINRDTETILTTVMAEEEQGRDIVQFAKGFVEVLRDMLVAKAAQNPGQFLTLPDDERALIEELMQHVSTKELLYFFTVVQNTYRAMRFSPFPKIDIETALLKITLRENIRDLAEIVQTLDVLKKNGAGNGEAGYAGRKTPPLRIEKARPLQQPVMETKTTTMPSRTVQPDVRDNSPAAMPEEQAPVRATTDADPLQSAQTEWPAIIAEIKKVSMSIGTFLSFGNPARREGNTLIIAFTATHRLNKETIESEKNKRIIEKTLSSYMGKEMYIKCVINDVLTTQAEAERLEKTPDNMENIIKSAMNIFQGKVVPE